MNHCFKKSKKESTSAYQWIPPIKAAVSYQNNSQKQCPKNKIILGNQLTKLKLCCKFSHQIIDCLSLHKRKFSGAAIAMQQIHYYLYIVSSQLTITGTKIKKNQQEKRNETKDDSGTEILRHKCQEISLIMLKKAQYYEDFLRTWNDNIFCNTILYIIACIFSMYIMKWLHSKTSNPWHYQTLMRR